MRRGGVIGHGNGELATRARVRHFPDERPWLGCYAPALMETTFGPVGGLHVEAYAARCDGGWLGVGRVNRGEETLERVATPILPLAGQALECAAEKAREA